MNNFLVQKCSIHFTFSDLIISIIHAHVCRTKQMNKYIINKIIHIGAFMFSRNLTHWGRVTHICVGKLTIIGSDNGLSPGRRQAIVWTNAGILLIRPLGTNFSEILIGIQTFSFKKMCLKMSSAKGRPFCLGLNVSRIKLLQCVYINWC